MLSLQSALLIIIATLLAIIDEQYKHNKATKIYQQETKAMLTALYQDKTKL